MTGNHYRAAGLLGTGVVGGAIVAATMGANAVTARADSGDAVYEAHLTKPDGTSVTVKFDKNL